MAAIPLVSRINVTYIYKFMKSEAAVSLANQIIDLLSSCRGKRGILTVFNIPVELRRELTEEEIAQMATAATQGLTIENRNIRNQLLADSDWTQGNDSPLNADTKVLWATYRSSLRSLPEHENWPNLEDADWPTKPS